jgi:hypothetical protein
VLLGYLGQVIAERLERSPLVGRKARLASVFVEEGCDRAEDLLTFSSPDSGCSSCFLQRGL